LMVFESAEDMEGWIVILRREIEALGGKKSLSETGTPKVDDNILHLRAQPSQRTLVVRDPDRFSKVLPRGTSWEHPERLSNPDIRLSGVESDIARDQSFDDTSTASGISQDGRQLDGLRDSTHRLSYISSGQRTVVTSAGSSPACSPIRDSFGSQLGELPPRDLPQEVQAWPRPRPNASAILDRRQSMQTMNHMAEMRVASSAPRPLSTTYSSSWQPPSSVPYNTPPPQSIPNFSVPHSVSKRYSLATQPPADPTPSSSLPMQQNGGTARPSRRPPPTAISINPRPLSLVVDQPSPDPSSPNSLSKQLVSSEELTGSETPSSFSGWAPTAFADEALGPGFESPSPVTENGAMEVHMRPRPRKHTTSSTIRSSEEATETRVHTSSTVLPMQIPLSPERPTSSSSFTAKYHRARSSMDNYGRSKSPPLSPGPWNSHYKRFSLRPASPDVVDHHSSDDAEITVAITSIGSHDSSIRAHTPTLFKASSTKPQAPSARQHLGVNSKALFGRRSMSRLTDIPPPAPPPTCALPPLPPPRKAS
jgi:hypothetical protein